MIKTDSQIFVKSMFFENNLLAATLDYKGSRYEIIIFKDINDKSVVVSVPNLFVSLRNNCIMSGEKKLSIRYKLLVRAIPAEDATNIELLVNMLISDFKLL